jgi:hypothetical protein
LPYRIDYHGTLDHCAAPFISKIPGGAPFCPRGAALVAQPGLDKCVAVVPGGTKQWQPDRRWYRRARE